MISSQQVIKRQNLCIAKSTDLYLFALNSNFHNFVDRNVTLLMATMLPYVLKTVRRQKQENMQKIAPVKEASSNVALGESKLLCIILNCNIFFLFFCWKEPNFTAFFISDTSGWGTSTYILTWSNIQMFLVNYGEEKLKKCSRSHFFSLKSWIYPYKIHLAVA